MTDITRVASDHLLHSTSADFDLNASFKRDMEQHRAEVAGRVVRRLEQEAITNAVKAEIRERMTTPQLDEQCAALLAQHNADVDRRKSAGEKRGHGKTYISLLEQAQREAQR